MRTLLKKFLFPILRPVANWYGSTDRNVYYNGIGIKILPGVFHPLLFISTTLMIQFMERKKFEGKKVLELGAGSGLISLVAAGKGAEVWATDISKQAVKNLQLNAAWNYLPMQIIQSDLFTNIPEVNFHYIFINPPYYPKDPKQEFEMAWFCGSDFEYFHKLFAQLQTRLSPHIQVFMILSEDCAMDEIRSIAKKQNVDMQLKWKKRVFFEQNFIFRLVLRN